MPGKLSKVHELNIGDHTEIVNSILRVGDEHGLSAGDVIKLIDTLAKYFDRQTLKPDQLDQALGQFTKLHAELYEWKELHNHLESILRAFDQWEEPVDTSNIERRIPRLRELCRRWLSVYEKVASLLAWANKIELIGRPYREEDGKPVDGERWSSTLAVYCADICTDLGIRLPEGQAGDGSQKPYPGRVEAITFRLFSLEPAWWQNLCYHSDQFHSLAMEQMHVADSQLLDTANKLYNLTMQVRRTESAKSES